LHAAARRWLAEQGFFDRGGALTPERVYFEPSYEEKIARVERLGCTHFVDDLEEFLAEDALPRGLVRILFEPHPRLGQATEGRRWLHARSWDEISSFVLRPTA
jgi:hypothetical protein